MPSKFLWETAAKHDLVVCRDRCWQQLFDRCCGRKSSFGTKVPSEYDPTGKGLGQILVEEDEIMKEMKSFYENLYASHDEYNN